MNQDIRIAFSFLTHRKRRKLADLLGPEGVLALIDLWISVAQSRPKGKLTGMSEADIALEARWTGDPYKFCHALLDVGFLDRNGNNECMIHDWREHQPYAYFASERSQKARRAAEAKWRSGAKEPRSGRLSEAKKKGNHSQAAWEELRDFFGTCVRCEGKSGLARVDRDHIIPIYQGGSHGIDNIQPLCARCNASKGPDNTDWRVIFCKNRGVEMPTKWINKPTESFPLSTSERLRTPANACSTPAPTSPPSPYPYPYPSPSPDKTKKTSLDKPSERDRQAPKEVFLEEEEKRHKRMSAALHSVIQKYPRFRPHLVYKSENHPEALPYALEELAKAKDVKNPEEYVNRIVTRMSGNLNEAEHIEDSRKYKKPIAIGEIFKNLSKGEIS